MTLAWTALVLGSGLVVVVLGVVVLGLLRRIGPVLEAAERTIRVGGTVPGDLGGLPAGASVGDFPLATLPAGEELRFRELLGQGLVVLFVQDRCPACTTLLADLDASRSRDTPLLLITDASGGPEVAELARSNGSIRAAIQRHGEASRAFAQMAFPHAFAVDATGAVVSQLLPSSVEDLARLGALLRVRGHDHQHIGRARRL